MLREWIGNGYVTRDHTNFRDQATFPVTIASPRAGEAVTADVSPGQVANAAQSPEQAGNTSVAGYIGDTGPENGALPPKIIEAARATQESRNDPARVIFDILKRFAQRLMDSVKQLLSHRH
jgi:hypothetical protein